MKVYNKLVRDRIPDIIRADGHIPQCETLDTARYLDALEQKLLEEAAEYRQTPCMEEMADLMEVIEAICKARSSLSASVRASDSSANRRESPSCPVVSGASGPPPGE